MLTTVSVVLRDPCWKLLQCKEPPKCEQYGKIYVNPIASDLLTQFVPVCVKAVPHPLLCALSRNVWMFRTKSASAAAI